MTLSIAAGPLTAYLLASVRIIAWLAIVPPFSTKVMPVTAKVVLSLGLALAVAPAATADVVAPPASTLALVVSVVTQVAIGAGMGFVTYLLLAAIAAAGSLIDLFGGFSIAQAFDPLGMNTNSVFGKFHQMLASTLLFVTHGHLMIVGGLLRTFHFLPVGESPEVSNGITVLTQAFKLMFVTAVQIALPMIAVLFLADLGLALLTKVAPQLNAINVMYPAKIGLTLLLLGLSFPVLPTAIEHLVDLSLEAMAAMSGGS